MPCGCKSNKLNSNMVIQNNPYHNKSNNKTNTINNVNNKTNNINKTNKLIIKNKKNVQKQPKKYEYITNPTHLNKSELLTGMYNNNRRKSYI